MFLNPGSAITVIFDINPWRETVDARTSSVYDMLEKKIIIAQTDPPILENHINKIITITYLARLKGESVRYGFSAKILNFIKTFRLASSQSVPAISLGLQTKPERYNIRNYYRVEPPSFSGLEIFIDGYPANLLNISLGGAGISHKYDFKFETGMTLRLTLMVNGQGHEVNATIKRIWYPEDQPGWKGLEFVSLTFSDINNKVKHILGKKIIDIQRELRSKELGR
jgi:c-di-GMP-binding flagellar brake protein YcgR